MVYWLLQDSYYRKFMDVEHVREGCSSYMLNIFTKSGSVAKKEADLVQWREKNESDLHHGPSKPKSF
ncbi:hypothetical protein KSF_102480 [Reticulibacter mediterranei]|uniref:Uncharacterized protein n=1 Tax=Reticulibacter mediterranei TaxID=2778369 RepID=A0A8J3J0Q8_9CHLR|nr:hypothetical protein KSF_102480 [Reticulibacter mediterranei]